MGNGFQIQIVNATPNELNAAGVPHTPYQMDAWQPPTTIPANSAVLFYGEFQDEEPIHNWLDDSAWAVYTMEGVSDFKMTIHLTVTGVKGLSSSHPNYEGGYGVNVIWSGLETGLVVYPPVDETQESSVGWAHNGVVTVGVASFSGVDQPPISTYPIPDAGSGSWSDDLTALRPSVQHWAANWMEQYGACIGELLLTELTLPGTHDAGTYPAPQITTAQAQYLNIYQQLQEGIRALDLRWQVDGTGPDRFYISHTIKIDLTLDQVLAQIQQFLAENPSEIVVVDMHRFENTWADQDFYDFANAISTTLGDLIIGPSGSVPSLDSVWQSPGRVVVGMGQYSGGAMTPTIVSWLQDNTDFWTDAVQQMWAGESQTTWNTIATYMDSVLDPMTAPSAHLWALMAQYNLTLDLGEPAYVPEELSTYFATAENGVKANIIHTDWWDRINSTTGQIISEASIPNFAALTNAVPLNLLKAYRKANNLPLWT